MPAHHPQCRGPAGPALACRWQCQLRRRLVKALLQLGRAVCQAVQAARLPARAAVAVTLPVHLRHVAEAPHQRAAPLPRPVRQAVPVLLLIIPGIQDLLQGGPLVEGVGQLPRRRRRQLGVGRQAGIECGVQGLAVQLDADQHNLLPAGGASA